MTSDNPKPPCSRKFLVFIVLLLIAGGILNFWGLFTVAASVAQLAAQMKNNDKASRETMIATQRAYMFATETQVISSPDGSQTQIVPKWENLGNTPANPVMMEVRCPILVEKKQEIPQQQMNNTPAGQQLQAPDQPVSRLKATFTPKESKPGGACIFSRDQLALLLPSKPHLYLTARAIYRDVFDGTRLHITDYCTDTVPIKGPDNKVIFQTNLCDKFNCSDNQCPPEERQEVEKEYGKL